MTVDDYDAATDSDCQSSSASAVPQFGDFARNGMVRVEVDEAKYGEVERMFRDGMGRALAQDVNVVALHKPSYSTFAGHARLEAFRLYSNAVAAMLILCMLGTAVRGMRSWGLSLMDLGGVPILKTAFPTALGFIYLRRIFRLIGDSLTLSYLPFYFTLTISISKLVMFGSAMRA
ncbi:hypothetical protein SASPL_107617 [Salvia splendens]|uniref:Uncharacterized protein n=1 Tax=Salvia splendens TaxID=180675 RepID=A0A8X8YCR2_SALSN|nr:hypothetical protein SASPL_107617 [Salvia splendens]